MRKKNKLIISIVFTILCMVSCGKKEEEISFNAVVTKKVYRPECVCDNVGYRSDSSTRYLSQKYFPEEYELYAVDYNGETHQVNLTSEAFHTLSLKDTISLTMTIRRTKKISYDTIITDFDCIVLEKFYFPEIVEIDTNKIKTMDGYYRDEIVETLTQEKSFVRGINLSSNETVDVLISTYERVSMIRMKDTIQCTNTEYKKRRK